MNKSIRFLKGIGEARAASFEKLGIRTIEELLYFFPRDHEDRTQKKSIEECTDGENVCISAVVQTGVRESRIRRGMTLYSMQVGDEMASVYVVWYNNKYVKNAFVIGRRYVFYGKMRRKRNRMELENPVYECDGANKYTGKIIPVYPLTGGLSQKMLQNAMEAALEYAMPMREYISDDIRKKYEIEEINFSMKNIHFPQSSEAYEKAKRRFIFEELLILQIALFSAKKSNDKADGMIFSNFKCVREFTDSLEFELTNAQKRTINEICMDFKSGVQANRLIQGDVGSGKTAVAAAAMYIAIKNNTQCIMMAPTEILAVQHFEALKKMFSPFGIKVVQLTGGMTKKEKELACGLIESGFADIIVGTHAVIQDSAVYKNIGLVIADEQHRFGVSQRARLMQKGKNPHMLIMSATPIPRTLALILYGDLKISVIDELPPGRKAIKTYSVNEEMRKRVYSFLKEKVSAGNQAYVVCPLVSETENEDLKNAVDLSESMKQIFPELKVGLLHGKMKAKEKEDVMSDFVSGKINILTATTVIEVGVNVPNANIMLIENAERFGLSQLHQLRGRVGRGSGQAFCILFCSSRNKTAEKRMRVMCESNDGFYISEEDLKLRGPGDFFGTRQHGLPELKIANLFKDRDILAEAQKCAGEILKNDPQLNENVGIKEKITVIKEKAIAMN